MELLPAIVGFSFVSIFPALVARGRNRPRLAVALVFLGIALTAGPWLWVLLFPNSVGMGFAYVAGPVTMIGSVIYAVLGSLFVMINGRGETMTSDGK